MSLESKQEYFITKGLFDPQSFTPIVKITWKDKSITVNPESMMDLSALFGELEALNLVIGELRKNDMLPKENELMFLKRYIELVDLNRWD